MKLIDLDKALAKAEDECRMSDDWKVAHEMMNVFKYQPTVEAIPIDKPFLKMRYGDYVVYNKKWLVDHLQTEWNILQGKEYQPSIPVEWIEKWGWKNGMSESMSLRVMIDDWEKENVDNQTDQ